MRWVNFDKLYTEPKLIECLKYFTIYDKLTILQRYFNIQLRFNEGVEVVLKNNKETYHALQSFKFTLDELDESNNQLTIDILNLLIDKCKFIYFEQKVL